MSYVFISYCRRDRSYARQLYEDLERHGFEAWIDDHLGPSDVISERIVEAIRDSGAILVLMTPESLASEAVQTEIRIAQDLQKPIFTLLLWDNNWKIFEDRIYLDVREQELPPAEFYERLGDIVCPDIPIASPELTLVSTLKARRSVEMVNDALYELWVKGMALDQTALKPAEINRKLTDNTRFRIRYLLPDPFATDMCERTDLYLRHNIPLAERLDRTLRVLGNLKRSWDDRIEIRFMPHRPATGYSIIDPHSSNSRRYLRYRVYFFHMDDISTSFELPYMFLYAVDPVHGVWYDKFVQDYEAEWAAATEWIPGIDS